MATWIALLRGIGGRVRTMPMKTLVTALEGIGLTDVRTYISTGNVVFSSRRSAKTLKKQIEACIEDTFGYESTTFVLGVDELRRAVAANPFPQADADPASLHLFFLATPAKAPKLDTMAAAKAPQEQFALKKGVFYFYTPAGFPASKVGPRIPRLLGVQTTARNWRTVNKVLELASA